MLLLPPRGGSSHLDYQSFCVGFLGAQVSTKALKFVCRTVHGDLVNKYGALDRFDMKSTQAVSVPSPQSHQIEDVKHTCTHTDFSPIIVMANLSCRWNTFHRLQPIHYCCCFVIWKAHEMILSRLYIDYIVFRKKRRILDKTFVNAVLILLDFQIRKMKMRIHNIKN